MEIGRGVGKYGKLHKDCKNSLVRCASLWLGQAGSEEKNKETASLLQGSEEVMEKIG